MAKLNRYSALWLLIFSCLTSSAQTFKTLVNFDQTDGAGPYYGTLAQGIDGALYGTTVGGGTHHDGVAFGVTTIGSFTFVHNFCSQDNCEDGVEPQGGMILGTDGNLYGTTCFGGNDENGTIYKVTRDGTLASLYRFDITDGLCPLDTLVEATDGNFYGTTNTGGAFGHGTVFRITPLGILATLHSFNFSDGLDPVGGLVQTDDGSLLGTAEGGGTGHCNSGCGTVFRITPSGTFGVIHSFNVDDGQQPDGMLMQASDGNIYGTTYIGALGYGTVFKISRNGRLTTIHRFNASDGAYPTGKLIQATDGNLYGTAEEGGASGVGTVFRITPNGTMTTLHSFDGTDGLAPFAGVVQHTNGNFYGTTEYAGGGGGGTVFELDMGLKPFVTFARASGRVGQSGAILGQGLKGTTDVSLNGVSVDFTVASDTHIIANIPQGATSGYVTVTTPSGVLTSNVPFRVLP